MRGFLHEIAVNDPWDYQGQNPIRASGRGIVYGPKASTYYLLDVDEPFLLSGELVRQILAAQRYEGDTIEQVRSSQCTVGVARIRPGRELKPGQVFAFDDTDYFAIGEIRRLARGGQATRKTRRRSRRRGD